jgi:chromosome segregation ATPase
MRRLLRFLVRLTFVLVVGVLIGVGLFYGVPWVYRRLLWPIQENSARVAILQEQVAKNSDTIFGNHRALQDRIVDLETQAAEMGERAAVEAQDQDILEDEAAQLARRIASLEDDLEAQQQAVDQVRENLNQAELGLEREIEDVQGQIEGTRRDLRDQIERSEEDLNALGDRLGETTAQLSLLQTAQDLLKVRLLLVEENFGTARDTLDLALAHLDHAAEMTPSRADELEALRARFLALDDMIVQRSFRTRPTLEALWADVVNLATPLAAQSVVTETQAISPLPTPTPSR